MGTLNKSLVARHRAAEKIIADHYEEFFHVGQALAEIREMKSYQQVDGYKTFDKYCQDKWGFGRDQASRYIRTAKLRPALPSPKNTDSESAFWSAAAVDQIQKAGATESKRVEAARLVVEECEATGNRPTVSLCQKIARKVAKKVSPNRKAKKPLPTIVEKMQEWTQKVSAWTTQVKSISDEDWKLNTKGHKRDCNALLDALDRLYHAVERE